MGWSSEPWGNRSVDKRQRYAQVRFRGLRDWCAPLWSNLYVLRNLGDGDHFFVAPETAAKLAKVNPGDVIITNTSENLEDVGKAVAWPGGAQIVTGGHATVLKQSQDAKYIAYWLQSSQFSAQKRRLATGTKVIDASAKSLATIRIPVPPIEVQREIVRILDKFTQMEAELEARRLQYAHYRDSLLTFPDAEDAQWIPMGELGKWFGGGTPSKGVREYWENTTIPWLSPKDMATDTVRSTEDRVAAVALERTALKLVPAGSVAFVVRSNILRRRFPIALVPISVTLNQDMRTLVPREGILPTYVAQICMARRE